MMKLFSFSDEQCFYVVWYNSSVIICLLSIGKVFYRPIITHNDDDSDRFDSNCWRNHSILSIDSKLDISGSRRQTSLRVAKETDRRGSHHQTTIMPSVAQPFHLLECLTYLDFTRASLQNDSLTLAALYYSETRLTLRLIPFLFQGERGNKAHISGRGRIRPGLALWMGGVE